MARGGRLPRAAGRPSRFLRTGHRRAISLSEAHLQAARRDARHTLGREAERVLQSLLFYLASRACERKGDIPRPRRGRPRRRRGARFRGGLLAAAEIADAAPATALRPEGPCCAKVRRCPDCPVAAARGDGIDHEAVTASRAKRSRASKQTRETGAYAVPRHPVARQRCRSGDRGAVGIDPGGKLGVLRAAIGDLTGNGCDLAAGGR